MNLPSDPSARIAALGLFRKELRTELIRWTDDRTSRGDFDGRERSIEIFDVPVSQQRALHRRLSDVRKKAAEILGGPVVVLFHSPAETRRHYRWILGPAAQITGSTLIGVLALHVSGGDLAGTFYTQLDAPATIVLRPAA